MIMRILAGCGLLLAGAAGSAWACSASDVLDRAKKSRDVSTEEGDKYKNAKDVVTEMMDEETIERDVNATEAGTGTLLMAGDALLAGGGIGATKDDYRWLLNSPDTAMPTGHGQTHGLSSDFRGKHAFTLDGPGETSTIREHVRLHIYDGLVISLQQQAGVEYVSWGGIDWYQNGTSTNDLLNEHLGLTAATSNAVPAPASAATVPTPAPVATPSAPVAPAVPDPMIDYAG